MWLAKMDNDERNEIVKTIFSVMFATNSTTLSELSTNKSKLIASMNSLPAKKRAFLLKKLSELITNSTGNVIFDDYIKPKFDSFKKDVKDFTTNIFKPKEK